MLPKSQNFTFLKQKEPLPSVSDDKGIFAFFKISHFLRFYVSQDFTQYIHVGATVGRPPLSLCVKSSVFMLRAVSQCKAPRLDALLQKNNKRQHHAAYDVAKHRSGNIPQHTG